MSGRVLMVTGSRGISSIATERALRMGLRHYFAGVSRLVVGDAQGVDLAARRWWLGTVVLPVTVYPARWAEYGKAAGPIRNRQLVEAADCTCRKVSHHE